MPKLLPYYATTQIYANHETGKALIMFTDSFTF